MKEIPLTQGKVALVDDEDFERVNQFKWCAVKLGNRYYAVRNCKRIKGETRKAILMHRFILNATDNKIQVDHKDHDGLNNRRINIRTCSDEQNHLNVEKRSHNKSGYKGVLFNNSMKKWFSQIRVSKRQIYLGSFQDKISAAKAYDEAAKKYHGEFACLNFPV